MTKPRKSPAVGVSATLVACLIAVPVASTANESVSTATYQAAEPMVTRAPYKAHNPLHRRLVISGGAEFARVEAAPDSVDKRPHRSRWKAPNPFHRPD